MSLKKTAIEIVLAGALKWVIILVAAGFILYYVSPKYERIDDKSLFNKVTGQIITISEDK